MAGSLCGKNTAKKSTEQDGPACPGCARKFDTTLGATLGITLICPHCGARLQVARLDPLALVEEPDWTEFAVRRGGPWRLGRR
jgi:predicted amidophosphoribosyltransferase